MLVSTNQSLTIVSQGKYFDESVQFDSFSIVLIQNTVPLFYLFFIFL